MKTQTYVKQMAVLSICLVGAALQTMAQPAQGGPGGPGGRVRFELAGDQQSKVREARRASDNERTQLNQKLAEAQKDAVAAALAEKPDEKIIRSKLEMVAKLQVEIGLLNCKNFKEVQFTEDQKEQLTNTPLLGFGVLYGGMGPGGMGAGFGPGASRRGGGPDGGPRGGGDGGRPKAE
jgi:hypothetical protein